MKNFSIAGEPQIVERIKNAIEKTTGFSFDEYATKCRQRELFFTRLIFVKFCTDSGINPMKYIPGSRQLIRNYYPEQYKLEMQQNKTFRDTANAVFAHGL